MAGTPGELDRAVAELARKQHELFTLTQLAELGFSPGTVRTRCRRARWRRVHRGVFTLAAGRLSVQGRILAAVLSSGPDAVASHRAAARLQGILKGDVGTVDVTVPRRGVAGAAGVRVHGVRALDPRDIEEVDRIQCTTVARTLLDLAETVRPHVLRRAIREAEYLRVFDLWATDDLLARSNGRRGATALKRALEGQRPHDRYRSGSEDRFHELWREAGLPELEAGAWIPFGNGGGVEPDFLWRAGRLVIEIDDRASHERIAAFEADRRRDRRLTQLGFRPVRFAAREVWERPKAVVAESELIVAGVSRQE